MLKAGVRDNGCEAHLLPLFACLIHPSCTLLPFRPPPSTPTPSLITPHSSPPRPQALADRLVEAFAEAVHKDMRTKTWGYAPEETMDAKDLLKVRG